MTQQTGYNPWVMVGLATATATALGASILFSGKPKKATPETSPFLAGNWAPISTEVDGSDLAVIEGTLPDEIDGTFIRNGPNPQFPPFEGYHLFEGDGMLHGVRIKDGKASFKNRFIQTEAYRAEKAAGQTVFLPILGLSGWTGLAGILWEKVRGSVGFFNRYRRSTSNTSMTFHHGKFLTLMEAEMPYLVYTPTLETKGHYDFNGKLNHNFTAHPKVDVKTGELMFFGYNSMNTPHLQYAVVDKHGNKGPSVAIDLPCPVMVHDFAITEHYSIIMDLPLQFKKENLVKGKSVYEFNDKAKSRLGLIPRHAKSGSEIRWFDISTCYVFHSANAWEEGEEVVLIAARYPRMDLFRVLNDEGKISAVLYEWRLNTKSGVVTETKLGDDWVEFPTINESLMGYKNRYVYAAGMVAEAKTTIVHKYDLQEKTSKKIEWKNSQGGEFVFIPKTNAHNEDDGWLIGYQYHNDTQKSSAVVLNASDLSLQARIQLPQRVPQGFHGRWLTREMLDAEAAGVAN